MILTRTPLRISFVGGGSDRPSFFMEEPGACVAAAIDKYVYVAVNPKYDGSIRAAYSVTENVQRVDDLKHELIRETLRLCAIQGIEVHSIADIPASTGLGSSSSFTVGLLAALDAHDFAKNASAQWLARTACRIEIDECRKPIGKQDQYAAAFGGLNLYGFQPDGRVTISPIECDYEALSAHCLLLDTGLARQGDAGQVLQGQQQDRSDIRQLAAYAYAFADMLSEGDFKACGDIMDIAWQIKRRFVHSETDWEWNTRIDAMYSDALHWGAWGGKLCGAGGGGFLLFLAPPDRHELIKSKLGLRHVPIRVGVKGCEVVCS